LPLKSLLGIGISDGQDQIGASQAHRDWLSQRSGGKASTVAEAFRSINDNDRDILSHAGVLVAIVQQYCFRPCSNCRAAPFCAILGDPDRGEGSQQQRLIADLCRGMPARIYEDRPFETAAVPARHDMGNAAAL
jgi:hypothetical protein